MIIARYLHSSKTWKPKVSSRSHLWRLSSLNLCSKCMRFSVRHSIKQKLFKLRGRLKCSKLNSKNAENFSRFQCDQTILSIKRFDLKSWRILADWLTWKPGTPHQLTISSLKDKKFKKCKTSSLNKMKWSGIYKIERTTTHMWEQCKLNKSADNLNSKPGINRPSLLIKEITL